MKILEVIQKAAPIVLGVCGALTLVLEPINKKNQEKAVIDKAAEKVLQKLSEQD